MLQHQAESQEMWGQLLEVPGRCYFSKRGGAEPRQGPSGPQHGLTLECKRGPAPEWKDRRPQPRQMHPLLSDHQEGHAVRLAPGMRGGIPRALKKYLSSPPIMYVLTSTEPLYLYLDMPPHSVSAVLVREEMKKKKHVYYVSRVLQDAETRYPAIEKFALALIVAAWILRPYFQAHEVTVLTDQPLKHIFENPDTGSKMGDRA